MGETVILSEKMTLLQVYNNAYRLGNPIIPDEKYDMLLMEVESQLPTAQFKKFRETLFEVGGSIQHDYIAGSLENHYPEDFEENSSREKKSFCDWLKTVKEAEIFISAKIDGMSGVSKHAPNAPSYAATRGDGLHGEKIADEVSSEVFKFVNVTSPMSVRSELALTNNSHQELKYKNRRNGIVGLVKKDTHTLEELSHIRVFAYQILGSNLPRYEQFKILEQSGFMTPKHCLIPKEQATDEFLTNLLESWKDTESYSIDGLVVCPKSYSYEDSKLPTGIIAFKTFSAPVKTTIIDVELTPSMNGRLAPVLIVQPTEIDGITVQRVSAYSVANCIAKGVGPGAEITIRRAGEVIPELVQVLKPSSFIMPPACPECSASVSMQGENAFCTNEECPTRSLKQIEYFLRSMGVEGVSRKSLDKWGITTFDELLTYTPKTSGAKESAFCADIISKVLNAGDLPRLLWSLPFPGIGEKTIKSIIKHFKTLDAISDAVESNLDEFLKIPKIQQLTAEKFCAAFPRNYSILQSILFHPKRSISSEFQTQDEKSGILDGKKIVINGTLSVGRKEFQKRIEDLGGIPESGISKTTDILIAGENAGTKIDKARAIPSILVMSEEEFEIFLANLDQTNSLHKTTHSTI